MTRAFRHLPTSAFGDLRGKNHPKTGSELAMLDGDAREDLIQKGVNLGFSILVVLTVGTLSHHSRITIVFVLNHLCLYELW